MQWKRPYRDWRLYMWYPLMVALPVSTVYSMVAYDQPGRLVAVGSVVVALATLGLWRITRLGVYLAGEQIRVVNWFRSDVFAWAEVASVDDEEMISGRQLVFRLTSGRRIASEIKTVTRAGDEVYLTNRQFDELLELLRGPHRTALQR